MEGDTRNDFFQTARRDPIHQSDRYRVKKQRRDHRQTHVKPGGIYSCFSLGSDNANLHYRSSFSKSRKDEVRDIRKKGACLRCRILKRACSGEDPCKTCKIAAKAAIGSRALMWMECIRPSFLALDVFERRNSLSDSSRIEGALSDLLKDDVYLDFHIPFELNVEAASTHLASWLSEDSGSTTFSVVGVFSCSTNTNLLVNALDPSLGRDLRLFVYLTTHLYTTDYQEGYLSYTSEEIQSVRDCVAKRLLQALDPLVRPSELEASENKIGKLRALFLLLLGMMVGMRYTCPEILDHAMDGNAHEGESKQEALLRLLCHYLVYIGKTASILNASDTEAALVHGWKQLWTKRATFAWNPNKGLEMHYRIEPPPESEDESLDGIEIEFSDPEEGNEFTTNSDLLKCVACGTFWSHLGKNGHCRACETATDEAWIDAFTFPDMSLDSFVDMLSSGEQTIECDDTITQNAGRLELFEDFGNSAVFNQQEYDPCNLHFAPAAPESTPYAFTTNTDPMEHSCVPRIDNDSTENALVPGNICSNSSSGSAWDTFISDGDTVDAGAFEMRLDNASDSQQSRAYDTFSGPQDYEELFNESFSTALAGRSSYFISDENVTLPPDRSFSKVCGVSKGARNHITPRMKPRNPIKKLRSTCVSAGHYSCLSLATRANPKGHRRRNEAEIIQNPSDGIDHYSRTSSTTLFDGLILPALENFLEYGWVDLSNPQAPPRNVSDGTVVLRLGIYEVTSSYCRTFVRYFHDLDGKHVQDGCPIPSEKLLI
ncbi:hypothetical protein EJ04DRAFT_578393 [Polyplosphaeria fusca]|uniref:Zn(2)-C6 fungal-type domain-containing protein n=1 Tax=Polyplosphaeria fusca TaxID=682080 RepID=A0A9P4QWH2_9PLEO|nr:hypothetical protein EJ04DRAFT_578393 [Polyplosphaeria fusca]